MPCVWLVPKEIREKGMHLIVASTPRIPEQYVNTRAKNFHWADMTRAMFEAEHKGAHNPVLLDLDGNVTEGPGFNVFAVRDGMVTSPNRGVLQGITRGAVIELCGKLGLPCEVRTVSGKSSVEPTRFRLVDGRRRDWRDPSGRTHPVQ